MIAKKHGVAERLADICSRLTTVRAIVSVTAQALNNRETDLELRSAAADALDDILNELLALRLDAELRRRLSKKARLVLGIPEEVRP